MGLPDRIEQPVVRVATCSSTKNHLVEFGSNRKSKSRRRSIRGRKEPELDSSDSQQSDEPRETQPVVTSENGVGTSRILEDINEEIKQDSTRSGLPIQHPRIRFDDTQIFIEPDWKVDDYNII